MNQVTPQMQQAQAWSDFWQHGSLTTFFQGSFQTGYDGPVAEFWNAVFDELADGNAMLDLATGNGAIPYLAAVRAGELGRKWRIVGLDYAHIRPPSDPAIQSALAGVELLAGISMEQTGLPEESFDLITSHFGFEYADPLAAGREVRRLLKPGGQMVLVMHHPESAVVQQARRDYRQTRRCLFEEQIDRKVLALLEIVGDARSSQARARFRQHPQSERLRVDINRSMKRLLDLTRGEDDSQTMRVAQSFLRVFADLADRSKSEKMAFVRQSRDSLEAYSRRMQSMARATMDASSHAAFVGKMKELGFELMDQSDLEYGSGELIGRAVRFSG